MKAIKLQYNIFTITQLRHSMRSNNLTNGLKVFFECNERFDCNFLTKELSVNGHFTAPNDLLELVNERQIISND